jgi:hypothetical protein
MISIFLSILMILLLLILHIVLPQFTPIFTTFFFFMLLAHVFITLLVPFTQQIILTVPSEGGPIIRILLISIFFTFLSEALCAWFRNLSYDLYIPMVQISCNIIVLSQWIPLIKKMFSTLSSLIIE